MIFNVTEQHEHLCNIKVVQKINYSKLGTFILEHVGEIMADMVY